MLLKKFKPQSNSTRHKIRLCKNELLKSNKLIKTLSLNTKKENGRCKLTGSITVRHKGSGCRKLTKKLVNVNQQLQTITLGTAYDPNRSSLIALKFNLKQKKFIYDIALENEYPGTLHEANESNSDLKLGFRTSLKKIPTGAIVSLIGQNKLMQAKYIKSAGNYGRIVNKTEEYASIKLPSGKIKRFKNTETATIGAVSNPKHFLQVLGKAGTNRKLNKRPKVRGIAMNPVDHPHGGRSNGGIPSVTPWGLPTKGKFKLKKRKYKNHG